MSAGSAGFSVVRNPVSLRDFTHAHFNNYRFKIHVSYISVLPAETSFCSYIQAANYFVFICFTIDLKKYFTHRNEMVVVK